VAARWRALLVFVLTSCVAGACLTIAPSSPLSTAPSSAQSLPSLAAQSSAATTSSAPTTGPTAVAPTAATSAPPGEASVVVIIDSGPDAGTYTATGDPNCGYGQVAPDTWSAQYGNLSAGPGDLSTVQLTDEADSTGNGDARIVSAFVTVGPIFGGRSYTLSLDRFSSGTFTHEITDSGSSALIHVVGDTIESPLGPGGISVDLTLSCPTVVRP